MHTLVRKIPTARILKEVPIIYDSGFLSRSLVIVSPEETAALCKAGCKCMGINGGCPPHAPVFSKLYPGCDVLFSFYAGMDRAFMKDMLTKMSNFTMWRVLTKILGYMCLRIGNYISPNMKFLSSGTCKVCKNGFRCGYGTPAKKCTKPAKRRFSLEATGVLTDSVTHQLWGFQHDWLKKDYVPPRLIQMGGILCKQIERGAIMKRFEEVISKEAGNV